MRSSSHVVIAMLIARSAGIPSSAPPLEDCIASQQLESKGQEPGPYIPPVVPGLVVRGTITCAAQHDSLEVAVRVLPPGPPDQAASCSACAGASVRSEGIALWGPQIVEVTWRVDGGSEQVLRGVWLFGPGFTTPVTEG